ncbi:cache domain-containing protein [Candidatus Symbiobacter mobilis]|uniref:Single Cache domain-containing protein n=1 Tax=Candidatus Symbiobacter mobilis CR TaxID=946483 RepID=U5N992_9BURK|nr:cache domain-containing protein [Candidatus Symbiobacter mobilis]AGX87962.1 hypothetical protein Cenrod_1882 [Candidatus Symbiobacter mobilis CR]
MQALHRVRAIVFGILVGVSLCAVAAERGTVAEAEAMAKKAAAYVKAHGVDKAAEEFTTGTAFKDRDLYVAFAELDGVMVGHGGNPKLVGKNLVGLKDPAGQLFYDKLLVLAKTKGKGWSEPYKFLNPATKKIEDKMIYVERVGDHWVGVGIYKG